MILGRASRLFSLLVGVTLSSVPASLGAQHMLEARRAVASRPPQPSQARQLQVPSSFYTRMGNATGGAGLGWLLGVAASKVLASRALRDSLTSDDKSWGAAVGLVGGVLFATLPRVDSRCAVKKRFTYGMIGAAVGMAVGGLVWAAAPDELYGDLALVLGAPYGAAIGSLRQCWS